MGGSNVTDHIAEHIAALGDEDWGVREEAATALGEPGNVRGVAALIAALQDVDRSVREAATTALIAIGEAAVPELGHSLQHPDLTVQEAVAKILSTTADERVARPLTSALLNTDWIVRMYAAKALAKLKWVDATETLILLLQDSVKSVRDEAVLALKAIGEPAVTPLIQLLDHREWTVRLRATEALGQLQANQAVGPLLKQLQQDPDTAVRQDTAKALGEIRHAQAVEPLLQALEQPSLRVSAIEALGKIGDRRACQPLVAIVQSLRTQDYEDRTPACEDNRYAMDLAAVEAAVTALSRIKDLQTLPVLVMALQSTLIRQEAVQAVVAFGAPAVPLLLEVLKSEKDGNVVFHVKDALARLGWRSGRVRL